MRLSYLVWCVVIGGLMACGSPNAQADPCGMVPPIAWAAQTPIKRVGVQMTYVFYHNNLETIVLRPGFSGSVDEFGMLIPFPSPPAIRKVPDDVFEQIAAAIDPPEVVIDLRVQTGMYGGGFGGGFGGGGGGFGGGGLGFQVAQDEVRVIRKEAVGMYEVAVLAAGNAGALKRWMEDHKFAYPSGMDAVCPEYIKQDWCFVAVKTKVNQKQAADPQPGQRAIDNALPDGASFDGHVQAMGFRFHTPELVVPMRLSVHNAGELRNVVYLLADNPSKIHNLPEAFVRRQISGFKLFDQLTKPLPLRIIGGNIDNVPRHLRIDLADQRDPEPHNGVAAELFASDVIAARTRRLESRSEAYEKRLFTINETLELRGPEIDAEVRRQVGGERARIVRAALKSIDDMTLTVIDGDFPREVLARENLTFAEYHMPLERSDRKFYDANKLGQGEAISGSLYLGAIEPREEPQFASANHDADKKARRSWLMLVVGVVTTGGLAAFRLPARYRPAIVGGFASLVMLSFLLAVGSSDEPIPALIKQSRSRELVTQGWAIVCLGRIGGDDAKRQLERLRASESVPPLVQTWAAAAMIQAASTTRELEALSQLMTSRAELARPFLLAFQRQVREQEGLDALGACLVAASRSDVLARSLAPEIMSAGTEPLVRAMLRSDNPDVRRTAAGYVASLARKPGNAGSVASSVAAALRFDPTAEQPPWHNGPLFLPSIPWPTEEAQSLVGSLLRWHVWADRRENDDARRKIDTNLRSVTLAGAAGYQIAHSSNTEQWLESWKQVIGMAELKELLAEQSAESDYPALIVN